MKETRKRQRNAKTIIKKKKKSNPKGRSRESRSISDGLNKGILVISNTLGLALDHNLGSEDSIKPKGLNIGLLANGPLARPKGVLPAHVVPIVHVEGQHHHRHLQLEVPSPQPRHHQLRRRRRRAPLRREHLHDHCPLAPAAATRFRTEVRRGDAALRDAVAAVGALAAEAGPETRRHRVVISGGVVE